MASGRVLLTRCVLAALTTGVACNEDGSATRDRCGGTNEWLVDCLEFSDCAAGCICVSGLISSACVPGCREDADCPENFFCDTQGDFFGVTGSSCVAGCRYDEHCPAGRICRDDECIPGCRDHTECEPGTFCSDGSCLPGCRSNDECAADGICLTGDCVPLCHDTDCPGGEICTPYPFETDPFVLDWDTIVSGWSCETSCAQEYCKCRYPEPGTPLYGYCPGWTTQSTPMPMVDASTSDAEAGTDGGPAVPNAVADAAVDR